MGKDSGCFPSVVRPALGRPSGALLNSLGNTEREDMLTLRCGPVHYGCNGTESTSDMSVIRSSCQS